MSLEVLAFGEFTLRHYTPGFGTTQVTIPPQDQVSALGRRRVFLLVGNGFSLGWGDLRHFHPSVV